VRLNDKEAQQFTFCVNAGGTFPIHAKIPRASPAHEVYEKECRPARSRALRFGQVHRLPFIACPQRASDKR